MNEPQAPTFGFHELVTALVSSTHLPQHRPRGCVCSSGAGPGACLSHPKIGELVGVSARTVIRWSQTGIPMWAADRAAIAVGSHPVLVWSEYHERIERFLRAKRRFDARSRRVSEPATAEAAA